MGVMPRKKYEKITWSEGRVGLWNTNAVTIGTTVLEAAAFEAKVEAARAAATAVENARIAAEGATQDLDNAIAEMEIAAQGIIKQVRAKAETTNNPGLYALSGLPAPVTPGTVGVPGTPYEFLVDLMQDGSLGLGWKCKNPAGCTHVLYQVWRRIGGSGAFTYVGGTGEKKFLDSTIPAGASQLTYQIQAVRSTGIGNWAQYNVTFGAPGSGQTIMVSQAEALPRMAA